MKRVIITGGTGMLGIALTKYLTNLGIQVTVLINPCSKRKNEIPLNDKVTVVECDLNDLKCVEQKLTGVFDVFFHFAWLGTYGDARNDMSLQTTNIQCTLDAVELANRIGCKSFLGAGSQAEYGRATGKISHETAAFPENGYGMAKLCAGQMSRIVCEKYEIKHIWMRILSTYGPFDGKHTMVMSGLYNMLNNEQTKFTKGEQLWDYLYCEDVAEAFFLAAEKGKHGRIYCLGSGQVKPLSEYISIMKDCVNPKLEPVLGAIPYNEKQVMYLCADIEPLSREIGFVPKTTFQEGIKKTLEWLQGENQLL